jgi:hypothetical protein
MNINEIDWANVKGNIAGAFNKGVGGALKSKSTDPATAEKGKAELKSASIKKSQSASGQRIKRNKMKAAMLAKWQKQSNKIISADQSPAIVKDYTDWVIEFMGPERAGAIANIPAGNPDKTMTDSMAKRHIEKLVNTFFQSSAKAKAKATLASTASADTPAISDATAMFTKMGHTSAEVAAYIQKAKANGADMSSPQDIVRKGYGKKTESLENNLMASYLTEGAGKNTHMEHIEDMVFNSGFDGATAALTYIEQVISMLAKGTGEQATVTTKWDGAPAIVCGKDPSDGKFFVGTKSVFAKTEPKLVKTVKNANDWYGDKQPELRDKLILCLKQLPKLGIGGVIQGDLMFDSVNAQPQIEEIDGQKMLTFGPNTIKYAVPANSDLAKTLQRAKLGIVFHTVYEGADMASMEASFGFDAGSLNKSADVWADDATYKDLTGSASLTPAELSKISNKIKAINATMSKIRPDKFNVVIENAEFKKYIKPYINRLVREDRTVGSITEFLNDFFEFYRSKVQGEIDKLKDPEGRAGQARVLKIRKQEEFLEDNMNHIAGVLAVFKRLAEIKLLIISKLQQVEGIGTFVKDGDGYKVTSPEGFVAIGHDGGAVKLVDRLEFSKNNFANTAAWKR